MLGTRSALQGGHLLSHPHPTPRLEKEIEELENADTLPAPVKETQVAPSPGPVVPAPCPAQEDRKAEVDLNAQQVRGSQIQRSVTGGMCRCQHLLIPAWPLPSCVTCTLCFASLDLSVPTMQGCHGGTWASVEDRRFVDRGFALNTTCLSPSHRCHLSSSLSSPFRWEQCLFDGRQN